MVHPTATELSADASTVSLGLASNLISDAKPKKTKGIMLEEIRYVDYRYYRFLLHPDGDFRMVRSVQLLTPVLTRR